MSRFDVVALGELLIDFAEKSVDADGYPTMAAHAGGAPANFLAALNHFGHKGALLGKVGDDENKKMLLKTLEDAGISYDPKTPFTWQQVGEYAKALTQKNGNEITRFGLSAYDGNVIHLIETGAEFRI